MLKAENVRKTFGSVQALDGLEMHVPRGAVYGLVGPNGAGKTTFLRIAVGAGRQDEGTVLIDGEPVWDNAAVKDRLYFIPDEPWFYPQATLRQMADFCRHTYSRFDRGIYDRLGEAFDFDDRRPLRSLSRGMKKQAAFRLALSCRPELLILDEPVDGLDPVMRRQVWSLILEDVAESETTVLVSSHNLRELEDVIDHVGMIDHGRCLREGGTAELQANLVKAVVALPEGAVLPEGLDILHHSVTGRLHTLIIRGGTELARARLASVSPLFMDTVPLTLEEIFIYEMGGADYAVKELLL